MRIGLLHQPWNDPRPPVTNGSIAIGTFQLGARLASRAEVITYGSTRGTEEESTVLGGVLHRRFPLGNAARGNGWLARLAFLRPRGRPYFLSPRYFGEYWASVARAAARDGCDLLHLPNFPQAIPILRQACPDARIVLHMHCEWLSQFDTQATGALIKGADTILGCSNHITRLIRAAHPDLASRCHTLWNGVDLARFTPRAGPRPPGPPRILFVGRISPEKGLHVLLDALRRLPETDVRIVGPAAATSRAFLARLPGLDGWHGSDYLPRLRALADDRVAFSGFIAQDRLPEVYRDADLLVNPSLSESFGMSLIEAMACGLPVVGTSVGGMPEIVVPGVTGSLAAPAHADELAIALRAMIGDPEGCVAMGARGRTRAEEFFGWEAIAERLFGLYAALAPERSVVHA